MTSSVLCFFVALFGWHQLSNTHHVLLLFHAGQQLVSVLLLTCGGSNLPVAAQLKAAGLNHRYLKQQQMSETGERIVLFSVLMWHLTSAIRLLIVNTGFPRDLQFQQKALKNSPHWPFVTFSASEAVHGGGWMGKEKSWPVFFMPWSFLKWDLFCSNPGCL